MKKQKTTKPQESTPDDCVATSTGTPLTELLDLGVLSFHVYKQAREVPPSLDESCVPDSPYAKPYFTHREYTEYKENMTREQRQWFLLFVYECLKADGL